MANLRTVRISLLERVVLEELATQWQVTTDEALTRLIRQAARNEVVRQPDPPADIGDAAQVQKQET